MIEKFNFYDIYGYLLPGTLLFGWFWLPFGIAARALPANEISTTLLLLALAYIIGHVLQNVASAVVPSKVPDSVGTLRAYSDQVLDRDYPRLGSASRKVIEAKVRQAFNLDIQVEQIPNEELSKTRETAFLQARAYLFRQKAATYVEQFEGLYAMMRGLASAFFVGCAYMLGWGFSFHWQWAIGPIAYAILVGAILCCLAACFVPIHLVQKITGMKQRAEAKWRVDQLLAASLLFAIAGVGYFLGTWQPAPGRVEFFVWTTFAFAPIAGARCLASYRAFALKFAETVWQNFSERYTPEKVDAASDSSSQ